MNTFRDMIEKVIKSADDKVDDYIQKEWKGSVETYIHVGEASQVLGQLCNVLVTSDRKFMHINPKKIDADKLQKIIDKYKLKKVK